MPADGTNAARFPREDFGTSSFKDSLLKPTKPQGAWESGFNHSVHGCTPERCQAETSRPLPHIAATGTPQFESKELVSEATGLNY